MSYHALKVLQLLVSSTFRSNCPEVTELRPDLQRAEAGLLLVRFPSLPRTHLKFAYSAMLHKVPSSRRKCMHDIISIPAVLMLEMNGGNLQNLKTSKAIRVVITNKAIKE